MIKFNILLGAALLLPMIASAQGKTLPYSSTMVEGSAVDPEWTIVDNNNDCPRMTGNGCWQYDSGKLSSDADALPEKGLKYQYHGSNAADDWAVSPALALKGGETYKVGYWFKVSRSSNEENLTIYVTKVSPMTDGAVTADYTAKVLADASTKVIADYVDYTVNKWPTEKMYTEPFTVDGDGEYYVGFYCHSERNRYNVMVRGFEIKDNKRYPATPTELTVNAAANDVVEAEISWTLPTTDTELVPLDKALDAVKVMRDGVEIATLGGDATSYTDTEAQGLTAGVHTYSVAVVYDGVQGESASVKSKWIGAIASQPLPYSCDFEDASLFETLWTVINPGGITAVSGLQPTCYTWSLKNGWLAYFTPYNPIVDDDDWAITPPLEFDKAGTYKVSVKAYKQSGTPTISMWLGGDRTAEGMTQKLGDVEIPSTANNESKAVTIEHTFDVTTPGKYYLGIYINGVRETSSQRKPMLDDLKVELVAELQVVKPPYDSAADENWKSAWSESDGDVSSPVFTFETGYYSIEHVSTATSIGLTNGSMRLIEDPAPATNAATSASALIGADEACNGKIVLKGTTLENVESVKVTSADLTPAAVADLKAESNQDIDNPTVNLSWTLPTTTTSNSWLPEIRQVTLTRDNEPLATYDVVTPGNMMSYVDTNIEGNKDYTYAVITGNLSGDSEPATVTGKVTSGVESIAANQTGAAVKVYNLTGAKVADSIEALAPGIYIVVKGDATSKMIVQ